MRYLKPLYSRLAPAIFGIFLGWSVAATRAAQDNPTDLILRVEQQRVAALVNDDFPSLDRRLADDLTYAHSSTVVETKAEYLASLRSGALKYTALTHESPQVRLYGDTAVLTGLSTVQALSPGQTRHRQAAFLDRVCAAPPPMADGRLAIHPPSVASSLPIPPSIFSRPHSP